MSLKIKGYEIYSRELFAILHNFRIGMPDHYIKMKLATAAIMIRNDTVLLARRKTGERLSGYWEFPGRKIEGNETPQRCLIQI